MPHRIISSLLLCLTLCASAAAANERGSPVVDTWELSRLRVAHLALAAGQMPDGRIVVANLAGVLRYDGVRWRLAQHPRELGGMQHLAVVADGRVCVSFAGDLGCFRDDATGNLAWHSLAERLPEQLRAPTDVLDLAWDASRQGLWFATRKHVGFIPDDGTAATVLSPPGGVAFGGFAGDYLVQPLPARELQRVDLASGKLAPVIGGASVASFNLWAQAPAPDGSWRLAGVGGQLLRYSREGLQPWSEAARSHYPAGVGLRSMLALRDGRFLLGAPDGVLVVDATGAVVDRYGPLDGIPADRRLHGLWQDREGDVWLAQDLGIVRVALARAATVFEAARGLPSATGLGRLRGRMYASSTAGLFRLAGEDALGGGRFERVLPELTDLRALAPLDDATLLVAASKVYAVNQRGDGNLASRALADLRTVRSMQASRFVGGRVYVAHVGGVAQVDRGADGEPVVSRLQALEGQLVDRIAEQDAHTLWAVDNIGGAFRLDLRTPGQLRRFGVEDGLPEGQVRVHQGSTRPWFTSIHGLRVFDTASERFVVPPGLPAELASERLFTVWDDDAGNLWVHGGESMQDVYWREAEGWRADRELLHLVDPEPAIFAFRREGDIVWAVRSTGLLRLDLSAYQPSPPPSAPLLTGVHDERTRTALAFTSLPALGPQVRDLRFEFALPSLHRAHAVSYRSRLAGYDDWSEWLPREQAMRSWTNLPDGEFRFELQARDAFGRVVAAPAQMLAIAPPWFRTRWAQAAWLGSALCGLWLAARLGARRRQRQMLARQRELEAMVAARTDDLHRSNAQLAEQAERLAEVDRLKTRFFVNVGHEFRTPLTLVLGPIDDLLRDARERLTARAREQLELALRNARRVLDLIVELLDVNRFEHGQMRLALQRTELEPWLQQFAQEQSSLVERYGHRLELQVDGPVGSADIDPVHLERALANLVSNAAKYMPRGGGIVIRAGRDGPSVRIEVVDEGRGIAPEALPHVFDRFFQAEGGDRASGYGIGLSLVREIVEAHGGSVRVHSTLGAGSCFTLELPALAAAAPGAYPQEPAPVAVGPDPVRTLARAGAQPAESPRARRRVLVVDDHADLRRRVRELLAGRFEVIEAEDGPSAWRTAQAELPDLVVADVMMPGFDGIELTRRLRADADTAALGILLLTARAGSEHAVAGLAAGANDYLAKPFDASELLARADAILGHAERLRLALQRAPKPAPVLDAPSASAEQRWRTRLDAWIEQHIDDVEASVEALAGHMHADRSALFRRCKETLGMSPSEYLREARLKHAQALLGRAAGNIAEISYAAGFDTVSGFTRAYKARFGEAPAAVLARARAAA